MPLEDVILPKTYKDGKVLFEKMLDDWRIKSEEAFADINLNFAQLAKDCFSVGYTFDNDGNPNKPISLEDRLDLFEGGGGFIDGTASDSFSINSDGNAATLDTVGLTSTHIYTFPDIDGQFMITTAVQNSTGKKTFSGGIAGNTVFDGSPNIIGSLDIDTNLNVDGTSNLVGTIFANAAVAIDLVALGNRIDLDADNDTSIRASADDTITIELNGVDQITINANGELLLPAVNPPTANFFNRNSSVKAFCNLNDNGTIVGSYNISSASKLATGDYEIFLDTDFDQGDYCVLGDMREVFDGVANAYITGVNRYRVATKELVAGAFVDTDFDSCSIATGVQ